MALAGGINTQLGLGEETTPGSGVTVSRFYELGEGGESVKHDIDRFEYQGLRSGGRRILNTSNRVATRENVSGPIELAVMTKGFGLVFKHCLGAVATTTPGGATNTRDHACKFGDLDGKSLTIQLGRTDNTGTTEAFTYAGCKVATWELSNDNTNALMLSLGIDGMSEALSSAGGPALASASYPSGIEMFSYIRGVLTVAGSAIDVVDWNLQGDNGLDVDRYFIRATTPGQKKQQLEGGQPREVTGTINCEWSGMTAYNRFLNGTIAAFTATYVSTTAIEGTFFPTITVTCPHVQFDGETPTVGGPEIIPMALPFKVLDGGDANGPVQITVRSGDTTA